METPRPVGQVLATSTFRYAALIAGLATTLGLAIIAFLFVAAALWERQQEDHAQAEFALLRAIAERQGVAALEQTIRERSARRAPGTLFESLAQTDHIYALAPANATDVVAGNLPFWPTNVVATGPGRITFAAPRPGQEPPVLNQIHAFIATLPDGLRLLVGRDVDVAEELGEWLTAAPLWLFLFGPISGMLAGWFASRQMLGRIDTINRTARVIMAGHLSTRIPVSKAGNEFDGLAATLNTMLSEIESLLKTVRRVTDDIAHDLRGPLTRVRQSLETTRTLDDSAVTRERIEDAIAELDGLLATFNAMMTIASAGSGAMRVALDTVPVAPLLRDVEELYRPLAEDRDQRFDVVAPDDVSARANRELLFQSVVNLVENAIKYTPKGGAVSLSARTLRGETLITVADNGPGIPLGERDRVLQPFVRLDTSRSQPGSGLGLSLVAAICKLHGARLTLSDNAPGLKVEISLPGA